MGLSLKVIFKSLYFACMAILSGFLIGYGLFTVKEPLAKSLILLTGGAIAGFHLMYILLEHLRNNVFPNYPDIDDDDDKN